MNMNKIGRQTKIGLTVTEKVDPRFADLKSHFDLDTICLQPVADLL